MAETPDEPWQCVCGETDVMKHDIGMVIAHEYGLPEQQGRDILLRIRKRAGVDNDDVDNDDREV